MEHTNKPKLYETFTLEKTIKDVYLEFEEGSEVQIVGISDKGYTLMQVDSGDVMLDCSLDLFIKEKEKKEQEFPSSLGDTMGFNQLLIEKLEKELAQLHSDLIMVQHKTSKGVLKGAILTKELELEELKEKQAAK